MSNFIRIENFIFRKSDIQDIELYKSKIDEDSEMLHTLFLRFYDVSRKGHVINFQEDREMAESVFNDILKQL